MKKRLWIIIIIAFIAILCTCALILSRKNKDISELRVIAEKSYINYAWGFQYKGEAILNDGTIVKWSYLGSRIDSHFLQKEMIEQSNWIINNSDIKIEKVSNKDLKDLNKYINKIQNQFEYESSQGADLGANCVKIYNYEEGEIFELSQTGDWVGNNNSEDAKKCLQLIEKYL